MTEKSQGAIRATLPSDLKPLGCSELVRVGRVNDGGYLMCSGDVSNSAHLLSFGVSDDWSFERDFQILSGASIEAFDGSVGLRHFVGLALRNLIFMRFMAFIRSLNLVLDFRRFFSGTASFHGKYVGEVSDSTTVALKELLSRQIREPVTLKFDIEGSEYRLFEDLLANRKKFTSIVLEVHDLDLHLDKVRLFLQGLDFRLLHIHINNFAKVSKSGIPRVVELTLSRSCSHPATHELPHKLDSLNNPNGPIVDLDFVDF